MNQPQIIVGCPIRNRAWILPRYYAAIHRLRYPNKRYLFLENDSSDDTPWILQQLAKDDPVIILKSIRTEVEGWDRNGYRLNQFENLANIRNRFIELFLETDGEYLFSVDSDVIVPENLLKRLLLIAQEQKSIVAAAISNIPGKSVDGCSACNFMTQNPNNGAVYHMSEYPTSGVLDVAVLGAVVLIPRQALEDGIRYAPHSLGEDIPFCLRAREHGYRLRVLLDSGCDHRMINDESVKEVR